MSGLRIDHTKKFPPIKDAEPQKEDPNAHMSTVEAALQKINPDCDWAQNGNVWMTKCGQGFGFPGDPNKDHGQKYCANCGRKINFKRETEKA